MRRPADWPRIRAAALDRDGHACVECGAPCPHPRHHEVDHEVPLRWLREGDPRGRDLGNLRTLCAACHLKLGAGRRL